MWIAYESHCFIGVELDYPESAGPMLFADCYASGSGLQLVAPNLATWISASAAAIEVNPDSFDGSFADDATRRCEDALAVAGIRPDERGPYDWSDMLQCPTRWQRQQGIDYETLALRGATHTIAELHDARRRGPVEATIIGEVRTAGGSLSGRLVVVDDGAETAEVWVPASVANVGGNDVQTFEVDVAAEALTGPETSFDDTRDSHIETTRRALAGDAAGATEAAREMSEFLHQNHPIVARALRPLT
jgi:hypothetical protein